MGERRDIVFKFHDGNQVVLYTHWHGPGMERLLASALDSREARARWSDTSYLTRILISRIIGEDWRKETGWGISPHRCGDENWPPIIVDLKAQTANGMPFDQFVATSGGYKALPYDCNYGVDESGE
jgi:hypothetical protein